MKISLKSYNTTTTIETDHDDLNMDELLDIFKSITICAGFLPESWDEAIREYADDLDRRSGRRNCNCDNEKCGCNRYD